MIIECSGDLEDVEPPTRTPNNTNIVNFGEKSYFFNSIIIP
jgi:hypothetical protein